jgi:seryl-tRNA synthetase
MLDPQLLRSDIDTVAKRLAARPFVLDTAAFAALESERKTVQTRTQELQSTRNNAAKRIGQAKSRGEDVAPLMAEAAQANLELSGLEQKLQEIQDRLRDLLLHVPNLPHASVPEGKGAEDNVELRRVGTPKTFAFTAKDHTDLGDALGLLDF